MRNNYVVQRQLPDNKKKKKTLWIVVFVFVDNICSVSWAVLVEAQVANIWWGHEHCKQDVTPSQHRYPLFFPSKSHTGLFLKLHFQMKM